MRVDTNSELIDDVVLLKSRENSDGILVTSGVKGFNSITGCATTSITTYKLESNTIGDLASVTRINKKDISVLYSYSRDIN